MKLSFPSGEKVPIWIKKGTFQFPLKPETPLVMVGPGTGVAPFRSFVTQQLSTRPEPSRRPMQLYFGCRHPKKDFYFDEEWKSIEEKFDNVRVRTAFSRESADSSSYVQDAMKSNSEEIFRLIRQLNGSFFVAGRAKQMPDQVQIQV